MGTCASSQTGMSVATAKVILSDGELREYSRPVKAAHVLEKEGPFWFLCDADVMDFDGLVSAVGPEFELRPGQLYFVLPLSMLRKPLQGEPIAALATKVSAALTSAARTSRSRFRRSSALVFAESQHAAVRLVMRYSRKGRSDFAVSLSAIPE